MSIFRPLIIFFLIAIFAIVYPFAGAQPLGASEREEKQLPALSESDRHSLNMPSSRSTTQNQYDVQNQQQYTPRGNTFWKGFTSSTTMIIATEIGDKTFFIAAVLCMRNSRVAVFSGAILALIAMTIISTVMGFLLPRILPKAYTHIFGGILFIYFGYKLLRDSQALQEYKVSDELEEVEEELLHTSGKKDEDTVSARDGAGASNNVSDLQLKESSYNNHDEESAVIINTERPLHPEVDVQNPKGSQIYQVFIQSLVLTFLAEWGDRSQIATIALAASHNPYGVTIGACFGHSLCTGLAVIGGRMLASRISEKTVTFWGGIIFLGFGLHSLFFQE